MSYQKFREQRDNLVQNTKATYLKGEKEVELEKIIDGIFDENTFISVFDLKKAKFTLHHNIKELLGYSNDEFTISNINNLGNQNAHITYSEDIEHKRRYDNAVYCLITNNNTLEVLGDYYEFKFRLYRKITFVEKEVIWVKRRCYILNVEDGIPTAQFDRWEIIDEAELKQTKPYYPVASVFSIHHKENAAHLFYEENRKLLGAPILSKMQQLVMNSYLEGKKLKDIASIVNKKLTSVGTHLQRAKEKYFDFFYRKDPSIDTKKITLVGLKTELRRFGLYPFY